MREDQDQLVSNGTMLTRFCLFIQTLFILNILYSQDEDVDVLFWGEPLSWSDFRGEPDSIRSENGQSVDALAQIAVVFQKDSYKEGKWCLKARAIFVANESWVRVPGEELLKHEQLHFDIFELIARKIRKFTVEYEGELTRDTFDKEFARLEKELEEMNKAYDNETAHGSNYSLQTEWEDRVRIRLRELIEFGEEVLICLPPE